MNKIKITIKGMKQKPVLTREEFERKKTLKILGGIAVLGVVAISLYCYQGLDNSDPKPEITKSSHYEDYPVKDKAAPEKTINQPVEQQHEESKVYVNLETNTEQAEDKHAEISPIANPVERKTEFMEAIAREEEKLEEKSEENFFIKDDKLVYKNDDGYTNVDLDHLVAPSESIGRKNFSLEISERNPKGVLQRLNDEKEVYFHTALLNQKGKKITHNWFYNGKVQFKKTFTVHGNRWRVWTSKQLWNLKGDHVYVLLSDETGRVLDYSRIEI